ncbi:MAG: transcriptional regulator [Peptococcaceae bacterium BRH_c4b]|nr:MAG: transcriptional regulator [Peptococcaceae bacterium BRH_c4b]
MTDISDLFWQASLQDIKQGYIYQQHSDEFICLICGKSFSNGIIYPGDGQLYEAQKYIKVHIAQCHRSAFHFLLNLDKKLTGLTDHQKSILELFYEGNSDNEVAKALGTGSTSTIRNHRFTLREKQKQAKVFLAIMELLGEQVPKKHTFIEIPRSSQKVDDRFAITEQESEKILAAYFKQGPDGPLDTFPLKEKKRVTILRHLVKYFDANKNYTEKEVNDVLKQFYNDYVVLRRNLIDYGFMDRTQDGSSYWIKL